jgi:tetratricopeptide (TPR) repeat protein
MQAQRSCSTFVSPICVDGTLPFQASTRTFSWPALLLCVGCIVLCGWNAASGQSPETNSVALPESAVKPTNAPAVWEPDVQLRAYLKMQEQLHATLLAVEQSRQESSYESRTNSDLLAARLEALENSLARQREQQWETVRSSNHMMTLMAASVIGLGLIALAFTALFQSRGMNRLAQIATSLSQERATATLALPHSAEPLLLANGAMPTQRTLLATVDQLQQRICELERTANPELPFSDLPSVSASEEARIPRNGGGPILEHRPHDHLTALVGKAQVLLSLGQAEEALACYDLALAHAPSEAELHLRRGQALERLKRHDEALVCYDRALALNRHLTQAYLSKGAVFNLQERYNEALACYEQALRSETQP